MWGPVARTKAVMAGTRRRFTFGMCVIGGWVERRPSSGDQRGGRGFRKSGFLCLMGGTGVRPAGHGCTPCERGGRAPVVALGRPSMRRANSWDSLSSQLFSFSPHGFALAPGGGVHPSFCCVSPRRGYGLHAKSAGSALLLPDYPPLPLPGCFALPVAVFRFQPVVSCNAAAMYFPEEQYGVRSLTPSVKNK